MTALSEQIRLIPKVDLHVHLEGTITPAMAKKIAERNGVTPAATLMSAQGDSFRWESDGTGAGSLKGFIEAYDDATKVMKKAQDYTDITYDYLKRSADEGCIYAEIGISADHGVMVGLTYTEMLDAITKGYERAHEECGIEMRMISTCVRHYGPEAALKVGKITHDNPHPLVTAFGMAGDENAHSIADFVPAYEASGLKNRTAHAGEASGPETVRQARDLLHIRRFGHMVRAIEDEKLMEELVALKAVPEVCVSSNLFLKVFPYYAAHPLRKFFDAGLKVTLGSDDPTFFDTSIGREYQVAHQHFGFTERELLKLSQNAVEEAFVDEDTRARLIERLEGYAIAA
ncbi:MAG: adenosine deaminase [Alphaproteobacteria bacterium]|nr:adenosine deaminase [Alphaproteobacteria bacterium]